VSEKREESDSPNPPPVIGAPVKPMSLGELMTWHANNGTLREFLARIGYDRDR
jgi:hypothetical protein